MDRMPPNLERFAWDGHSKNNVWGKSDRYCCSTSSSDLNSASVVDAMDLSSPKVSADDKLDLCKKYFYIGFAFLPLLWAVNAVWFVSSGRSVAIFGVLVTPFADSDTLAITALGPFIGICSFTTSLGLGKGSQSATGQAVRSMEMFYIVILLVCFFTQKENICWGNSKNFRI